MLENTIENSKKLQARSMDNSNSNPKKAKRELGKDVMDCAVKDDTGLNDFQKLPSAHHIAIPKVGIERFRVPLNYLHADGNIMNHDSEVSMFVSLEANKTGVNMSRFPAILQAEAAKSPIDYDFIEKLLTRYRADLRDFDSEELVAHAYLDLNFQYPLKQPSLKSENWGWQYYNVVIQAAQNKEGKTSFSLTLDYEYSSTCPCSLSMAKQYEQDYRSGKIAEGNGIATAHSQRSNARVQVDFAKDNALTIEQLVDILKNSIPTETQSLVKRVDEQAFAILNGENPIFVEHVARQLSEALDDDSRILNWNAYIQHWESLHSHNAVAYIQKVTDIKR